MESHRLCQGHEGGARAPLGGVLQGAFPSGRYEARRAKPSGVHREKHLGATRVKSHAWQLPPTCRNPPSRRGWRAACLHRLLRAQPSRVSGAFLAFAHGTLRGSHTQLRLHAFQPAKRGCSSLAPNAEHSGSLGGQAPHVPSGDGDGPRGTARTPRASRGSGLRWLVRIGFFTALRQLLQHPLYGIR